MEYFHQPVMVAEVLDYLRPKADDHFIDATLGGGGHLLAILPRILPKGIILAIDLDPLAIQAAQEKIKNFKNQIIFVKDNFKNLKKIVHAHCFNEIHGILFDLGLSSGQLQDRQRGFSFLAQGQLDMRFGDQSALTAVEILNNYNQLQLENIFKNFGQEKLAKPIVRKILEARKEKVITRAEQLITIIAPIYRKYYPSHSKINPATKIFQALRIAVNEELENLKITLPQAVNLLVLGGRLAIISYHSLEDKIVKDFFRQESRDCICLPSLPVCQCGHKKSLKIITKKPIGPSEEEIFLNHRARSAKLRVAEKII